LKRLKALSPGKIMAALEHDKKILRGGLAFILPQRIGSVVIRRDVPQALVKQIIGKMK
jgi:3-dehydroquinate synthetase